MPDRTTRDPHRGWNVLGRLLPREVRERVFEPALADLTRSWLTEPTEGRRLPFPIQVAGTLLACLPIAIPQLFFVRGRLTRAGRIVVGGGAVVVILLLVVLNIAQQYEPY